MNIITIHADIENSHQYWYMVFGVLCFILKLFLAFLCVPIANDDSPAFYTAIFHFSTNGPVELARLLGKYQIFMHLNTKPVMVNGNERWILHISENDVYNSPYILAS